MRNIRPLLKDCLPPIVLRTVAQILGSGTRFEGNYSSWEEAATQCGGYAAENILTKVLDATLKVKQGDAAFERDSVAFHDIEYNWPVLAAFLWAASRNAGFLNVLDFGGALGSSYFQNRRFLETLRKVSWNVIEQPHYVRAGKEHIQDERLRFYLTIDSYMTENQPNVILLSSVLQYLPNPFNVLDKLAKCGASCLIIDRTPYSSQAEDCLVIQHVPSNIYRASYPMWIFSWDRFVQHITDSWEIFASHICPEGYVKTDHRQDFSFKGMLLSSKQCSKN